MAFGHIAFAFVAGLLSIFSPCVVPVLPLVLGAAVAQHRLGPLALAAGLALSFVSIGLFVALAGFSLGLDQGTFQNIAAVLLIVVGIVLLVPALQQRLAVAGGPLGNWLQGRVGVQSGTGLSGQFGVGLLLGAVWAPCVGPTLGAASLLAAKGKDLGEVALTMVAFGLGTALPLLALGLVSREAMIRWRSTLLNLGTGGKHLMGGVLVLIGALIISGADHSIESWLVSISPPALTQLTTRF